MERHWNSKLVIWLVNLSQLFKPIWNWYFHRLLRYNIFQDITFLRSMESFSQKFKKSVSFVCVEMIDIINASMSRYECFSDKSDVFEYFWFLPFFKWTAEIFSNILKILNLYELFGVSEHYRCQYLSGNTLYKKTAWILKQTKDLRNFYAFNFKIIQLSSYHFQIFIPRQAKLLKINSFSSIKIN